MARIEKKTKIRYLPAKAQLTQTDSVTGSFPTIARTAGVDNRSGRGLSFYDDSNTRTFISTSVPMMSTPVLSESFPRQIKMNPGQELQPYFDSGQEAVDGKSSSDPFWSMGSDFDGLREPLWSKHKIEIDITPQIQTAMTATQTSGYGAIYNFDTKRWIQGGQETLNVMSPATGKYNPLNFGFTPSFHTKYIELLTALRNNGGQPFSNFGFPWSMQVPNSSLFKMSTVIDKPFLLEKVYIQLSASYIKGIDPDLYQNVFDIDGNDFYDSLNNDKPADSFVINNFYILNQRADYKSGQNIYSTVSNLFFSTQTELEISPKNITNDLVTWFNILSYNANFDYDSSSFDGLADVKIFDPKSTDKFFSSWSQNLHMSGATAVPDGASSAFKSLLVDTSTAFPLVYDTNWLGGRNGVGGTTSNGRDFVNANKTSNNASNFTQKTTSPYLLMPGDALSFNWQMPMPETFVGGPFNNAIQRQTSALIFHRHPAKVILYGTYLSENEGTGDTLNQLLSSESIHEAL